MAGKPKYLFSTTNPCPVPRQPPPPALLCCKYELHSPTWTQHWRWASKYSRKLYLAVFLRWLLVTAGASSPANLTADRVLFWRAPLVAPLLPCCWRSGPRPPPAGGPGRPAAGDVQGTRRRRAWSRSRGAAAGPWTPRGLDLAAGRWGEGRRPAAGWGHCCRGRPPAWAPPEEGEVKVSWG